MTIEAIRAINAFLSEFKYTNDAGKRVNSNMFMRLFQNKKLTFQLETIANALRHDLEKTVANKNLSPGQMINVFEDKVTQAWKDIKKQRDILAPTNTHTSTRSIISPTPFDVYGPPGSHEIAYYETHKPYGNGKFEANLIAGLNAAAKYLICDHQKFCLNKASEIAAHKPQETRTPERTFKSTGN